MDLSSDPPSRSDSPIWLRAPSPIPEDSVLEDSVTVSPPLSLTMQRQTSGFGDLLKSAKLVSRVAEFDLSSFGDFSTPQLEGPKYKPPLQEEQTHKPAKPIGVGNLMAPKNAVNVPEFDMNNFF
jgi:hypothetical protein